MRKNEGSRSNGPGGKGRTHKRRKAGRGWLSWVLGPLSFVPWLVGCQGDNRAPNDPLLGINPTAPARPAPPASGSRAASMLPPMPAPTATTSPAALAGGRAQPLDPNHDLRIGSPSGGDSWKGQATPTGVTLRGPEAAGNPPPRPEVGSPRTGTLTSGTQGLTLEQALSQLAARGMSWYRLEPLPDTGETRFECSLPDRQQANRQRHYDARGRDSLAAVQAVLDQVKQGQ